MLLTLIIFLDPVVGFDPTIYNTLEDMPGQLEICVVLLSAGTLFQNVPVQITTADGSATGIVVHSL